MERKDAVGSFSAVISAAGQASENLARRIGTVEKCSARFDGKPIAESAVWAAIGAGALEVAVVCDSETQATLAHMDGCLVASPGASPVLSAVNGVKLLTSSERIVFLPGDLPFVQANHISDFLCKCPDSDHPWVAAGTCSEMEISSRFPGMPGIRYSKLSGRRFAAGGIFAASPAGFEIAVNLAHAFSEDRKSAIRMAWKFGFFQAAKFMAGWMSTQDAEHAASRLFGCPAYVISDCAPELIADIDEVEDWDYLLSIDRTEK